MEIIRNTKAKVVEEEHDDSKRYGTNIFVAHKENVGLKKNTSQENVVTKISSSLKNENRVNIFIDGSFEFSLDIAQVVDFKLKVGKQLTNEEKEELKQASEFGKLYQRSLEWVLSRPHSVKEARDYLKRKRLRRISENKIAVKNRTKSKEEIKSFKLKTKEIPVFSEKDIDLVIKRLMDRGYLNDERFTEYYVENRNVKKGISLKKLKLELSSKGIAPEVYELVLSKSERSDNEEILKIIEKKKRKYNQEKMISYLIRQGFDYQLSRSLVQSAYEKDLRN